ncbi:hypothetical protein ACR82Z_04560 [Mycoplasma sp. 6243]|uniref:hypothetical protein n=1 Tax=Mycoplasma sp. 6243 TaxID=3440865 RepID=UPI003EC0DFA0
MLVNKILIVKIININKSKYDDPQMKVESYFITPSDTDIITNNNENIEKPNIKPLIPYSVFASIFF